MTTVDLDAIHLTKGAHQTRGQGVCLMELVAWFAGKPHTDRPPCVSGILGAYGRKLNDVLPDDLRQRLKPYVPLLPGTAGDGKDETRSYIALDWLIRTYLPAFLDVADMPDESMALRAHSRIGSLEMAESAGYVVRKARDKAYAARAAARAAAEDAALAAAEDAAWPAAEDAAWAAALAAAWPAAEAAAWAAALAAAWAAAEAAAWAAALAAAWAAAWAAARAAAVAAAEDAARAAARAAAGDAARVAAGDAAWAVLAPAVASLQQSAISLYAHLIAGEWPDAS